MKRLLALLSIILFSGVASAQSLHSVREIINIVEESNLSYALEKKDLSTIEYEHPVLVNEFYLQKNEDGISLAIYEINSEAEDYFKMGEELFQERNWAEARKCYQQAMEAQPELYKCLCYIGDTYYLAENFSEAKKWYEIAISQNRIDYLAHWALANACMRLGDKKQALQEITISKILNRNNPRLQTKMDEIYKANKKAYNDWYCNPLFELESDYDPERDKDIVRVKYDDIWLMYALVRAVWEYEPNYRESMGEDPFGIKQDKEALGAMLSAMEPKELKAHIDMRVLKEAIFAGKVDAFIIYELILPQLPQFAYYLTEETIQNIADYVLNVRSKIKK